MRQQKLKAKASARSEEWAYAFQHIEDYISKAEVEDCYKQTLDFIKRTIKGRKAGFGWSGGKESIVLADLMRDAGVSTCCFVFNSNLYYRSYAEWALQHMPEGLQVFDRADDFNFAVMSRKGIDAFSENAADYNRFMDMNHRSAYPVFCKRNGLDMFIMGRRKTDNNVCGKAPDYILRAKGRPYDSFSPMAEWSVEEVLGYIHYFRGGYEALPPQYQYFRGWHLGSDSPIFLRLGDMTRTEMWAEVYKNEPALVERAAKHLQSARDFLATRP